MRTFTKREFLLLIPKVGLPLAVGAAGGAFGAGKISGGIEAVEQRNTALSLAASATDRAEVAEEGLRVCQSDLDLAERNWELYKGLFNQRNGELVRIQEELAKAREQGHQLDLCQDDLWGTKQVVNDQAKAIGSLTVDNEKLAQEVTTLQAEVTAYEALIQPILKIAPGVENVVDTIAQASGTIRVNVAEGQKKIDGIQNGLAKPDALVEPIIEAVVPVDEMIGEMRQNFDKFKSTIADKKITIMGKTLDYDTLFTTVAEMLKVTPQGRLMGEAMLLVKKMVDSIDIFLSGLQIKTDKAEENVAAGVSGLVKHVGSVVNPGLEVLEKILQEVSGLTAEHGSLDTVVNKAKDLNFELEAMERGYKLINPDPK